MCQCQMECLQCLRRRKARASFISNIFADALVSGGVASISQGRAEARQPGRMCKYNRKHLTMRSSARGYQSCFLKGLCGQTCIDDPPGLVLPYSESRYQLGEKKKKESIKEMDAFWGCLKNKRDTQVLIGWVLGRGHVYNGILCLDGIPYSSCRCCKATHHYPMSESSPSGKM